MSGPEERLCAVELYSAMPMTTVQVARHLGYPTRQCPERWLAKDPGYAGHMAKPIIPLETRAKAIEPVPGGMRQKRAAERLGAGVGAVRNRVKAYREGGMAALQPKSRNAAARPTGCSATRAPRSATGSIRSSTRTAAAITGVCCVKFGRAASSGKTNRHRLNKGGNRQGNSALHRIAIVRMRYHQPTRDYVNRKTGEGKGKMQNHPLPETLHRPRGLPVSFVKSRWTCSAVDLDTVGVHVGRYGRLVEYS